MRRAIPIVLLPASLLLLTVFLPERGTTKAPLSLDRSPIDVALSADGHLALTANATSNSASLVNLRSGKVVAETTVGTGPFGVAFSKDATHAVITNKEDDSISILDVSPDGLHVAATVPVGDEPRGIVLTPDGRQAIVALAGDNALAFVDLPSRKITERLTVGTEPWHLALSPDGKHLAVGCARSQEMCVIDASTHKILYNVRLRGHNVRHVAMSPDSQWAYVPNIAERGRPVTKENIDQGWVIGNRLSRVPLTEEGPREAIALDTQGKAVGDVDGVAVSPDGQNIAVTCAGTHELLLLRQPLSFVAFGGPADHIDPELLSDKGRFRRVALNGRPLGAAFAPDGKTVIVANYLSNSLQVVDVEKAEAAQTIPLGGPESPSLARRGEAIFMDATRSFHQWYSCNSCHVEGNTNGSNFDTLNDGSYGTPKKTLSLRGVARTGPWTWHGWQKTLRQLVHDSSVKSMQGEEPSEADLDALVAYLGTLEFRRNPHRAADGSLSAEAKRGEAVFKAKACDTCHAAPDYTTPAVYTIGLEKPEDAYKGFNPPSLRDVYSRSPYLHTGEASTLDEVLTQYHRPSKLTGKPDCTPEELRDLVAFLKSL